MTKEVENNRIDNSDDAPKPWIMAIAENMPRVVCESEMLPRVESRPRKRPRARDLRSSKRSSSSVNSVDQSTTKDVSLCSVVPETEPASSVQQPSSSTEDGMQESKQSSEIEIIKKGIADEADFHCFSALREFMGIVEKHVENEETIANAHLRATSNLTLLSELSQNIRVQAELGDLSAPSDCLLRDFVDVLQTRITVTAESLRSEDKPTDILHSSLLGMHAVIAYLSILSSRRVPRALIIQEFVENAIKVVQLTCKCAVFPSLDKAYKARSSFENSNADGENDNASTSRGSEPIALCQSRPSAQSLKKRSAQVHATPPMSGEHCSLSMSPKKIAESLLGSCCQSFDLLAEACMRERMLPDSTVLSTVSLAMSSLDVASVSELNHSAIRLIEAILSSYPVHALSVIDRAMEHIGRVSPNRRQLRECAVPWSSCRIRFGTALVIKTLNIICGSISSFTSSIEPLKVEASGVDECRNNAMRVAFRLVDGLLSRLFMERDDEFRVAFNAFLEDLMVLYALPEWPAVELIVQAFCVRIVVYLRRGTDLSVYARCACMDLLGIVLARLLTLFGAAALADTLAPGAVERNPGEPERHSALNQNRCKVLAYLGSELCLDHPCLCARQCHVVMFLADIGDMAEELLKRERGVNDSVNDGAETVRDVEIHLRDRRIDAICGGRAELAELAELTSAANCFPIERSEALSAMLHVSRNRVLGKQVSRMVEVLRACLQQPEPTIRVRAIKALTSQVDVLPTILALFPNLLTSVENSCLDVSKSVREASLDLLSRSFSGSAAEGHFSEISSGADEVKLYSLAAKLGLAKSASDRVVNFGPEFLENVLPIVQQRLLDSAVSVRKRAILILREVLKDSTIQLLQEAEICIDRSSESFSDAKLQKLFTPVCCALIERLDDREDTVRSLAEQALRLAFFCDGGHDARALAHNERCMIVNLCASRLIDVHVMILTRVKGGPVRTKLVPALLPLSDVEKKRDFLVQLSRHIVDLLHGYEDDLVDLGSLLNSEDFASERSVDMERCSWKRLACSFVLESLAAICPSLIVPHVKSLAVVLKGVLDAKKRTMADVLHIQRILGIIEFAVPGFASVLENSFINEMMRDIEGIVCMCPSPSIAGSAIKTLCALARHCQAQEVKDVPRDTAKVFHSFLDECRQELASATPRQNTERVRNARQALPRLGLLARYGQFDCSEIEDMYELIEFLCKALMSEWSLSPDLGKSGSGELRPRVTDSFALRARTIQALTHFLVGHRTYLARAAPFLLGCLCQGCPADSGARAPFEPDYEAQITVLSGLQDILDDEESRNVSESGKISENAKSATLQQDVVLAAEDDVEAGYLAVCAQALAPQLCIETHSASTAVRRMISHILGSLVKQGLVLPANIVPALYGLLVDDDCQCRESARHVMAFLAERYPSMLSSATGEGLQSAVVHVTNTRRLQNGNFVHLFTKAIADDSTGYSLLSPAITMIRREQRRGVLASIVKCFDPHVRLLASCRSGVSGTSAACNLLVCSGGNTVSNVVRNVYLDGAASSSAKCNACECTPDDTLLNDENSVAGRTLTVHCGGASRSFAQLLFYATTLATLDYACGLAVGGLFTASAGTAAAELKLRKAREDVYEVTSIISRIISNSGQALLDAVESVRGKPDWSVDTKCVLAQSAVPLCLLLFVKRYLKVARGKGNSLDREDSSGTDTDTLPAFDVSSLPRAIFGQDDGSCALLPCDSDASQILDVFSQLMEEDNIDENDMNGGLRHKPSKCGRKLGKQKSSRKQSRSRKEMRRVSSLSVEDHMKTLS